MSRNLEKTSSYRHLFEATDADTFACRLRGSSPSPTRRETRHRSTSFTRTSKCKITGQRSLIAKPRLRSSSVSMEALCLGASNGFDANCNLDVAAAENQAFKLTRTNERQEMVVLNDRLAVYIEKVRTLETKNNLLEAEIEALKNSYERTAGLRQLYASQLKDLNREAEQMKEQKELSLVSKELIAGQLNMLQSKYNEALEARKQTEFNIEALRPDVDKATSTQIKLEKKLENLEVELSFLQKVHKEEIEELIQQIHSVTSKSDLAFGLPDLSSALAQIQSQYDSIAAKNLQEMDQWYKTKFQDLNDASTKHAQKVRSMREEIAGYRKDILNKERDLESLKTRNEFLESSICEIAEKHKQENEDLQEYSESLTMDLKLTKEKTALLMREYQELLNAKMALEIEITTYRKLIEGEDNRLSTMIRNLSLTNGPQLPSCSLVNPLSVSNSLNHLKLDASETRKEKTEDLPAVGSMEVVALANQTEKNFEQQASEMSERKTVLIRTVKTDGDAYVSNTQQRTIIITGAAQETDEE